MSKMNGKALRSIKDKARGGECDCFSCGGMGEPHYCTNTNPTWARHPCCTTGDAPLVTVASRGRR
jgi:hypothetical protein